MESQKNSIAQSKPSNGSSVPEKWLDRLNLRFSAMYGAKFTSTITTSELTADWRQIWGAAIAGLTADQIRSGLEKCITTQSWPPSPAEFRALCLPVIDYEGMFIQAANGQWKDKLTYWAAQSFGAYDLRRMSYHSAKERWIKIVDVMASELTLPNIPDQAQQCLPAPGQTSTAEVANAGLDAVKAALNNNPHRKWACEPKSQRAVELMFTDPPMTEEIEIATQNGYIVGKNWVPPEKRGKR